MTVRTENSGSVLYAYLSGEIDHHTSKSAREAIDAAINDRHPEMLVMDFKDVSFMDSSGIGLVMGRYKELSKFGGELHIENTTPHIKKVMQLSGIERLAVIGKGNTNEIR